MVDFRFDARPSVLAFPLLGALLLSGCVAGAGTSPSLDVSAPRPTSAPSASAPSTSPAASGTSSAGSPSGCGVATWARGQKDLVLRLAIAGGLLAPGADLTSPPVISVYGDGRVITQGPQIMIYPGPALPNLQVQVLNDAGMRRLLDVAAAAGLLVPDTNYPAHGIADAATSFFTLTADACTHRISAYALNESNSNQGLDQATIDARTKLLAFAQGLTDLTTLVGRANIRDAGAYTATAYRLIVSPEDPSSAAPSGLAQSPIAWPLATLLATFGEPVGPGSGPSPVRCGVVDGAEAATLRPLLEKANTLTPWASGGATFNLRVRPLLPDESGCTANL
jgi:hypothetical protein